ncbi:glycosyltransferase family 9 protein [Fusobacterium periodonticum]|uniref:glycosyltransferase family 9 protein n=1 Tax=Fusobacterium periodonticum TaxID=860 RepID=UPI0028D7708E|nr:glycosyltransferase family 9 protein [Fusobacterium periodonticum]
MIRKLNRIFQDYMREKRLKIGKTIWDKKEKTNIISGNNFIEDNNIKSILFLRYDGKIGDMIVNSLMFREIKKVFPDIKIGLIARGAAIDIVKNNPNIDEIYEYHKDRKKIKELALKIKEEKYDLLIDFSEMLRVNQMMLINLCGARINIGIEKENWKLFDVSLNVRDFNQHISELYIKILKFLGIKNINSSYDVFSSNYLLKKIGLENKKYCVFNPYAASKHRSFSSENIEKISKIILEKDYEILILIGSKDKIEELKKLDISKETKVKVIETKGMSEVAELIKGADLIVSPDTSIVHLAKAFDKKMLCIYRKELGKEDKNSILWGPNSEKAKVIFVEEKIKDGDEININNLNLNEFKEEMERV